MTANSINGIASSPISGLGTFTYNIPTTSTYTIQALVNIPWITSDQPSYGSPLAEVQTVTTVADSSGSLNNTYFEFYTAGNPTFFVSGTAYTFYYVWYNINSAGSDPAPSGGYGIQVTAATNASNSTIATNTQAAIAAVTSIPVKATVSGHVVTLANTQLGSCTAAVDTGTTGFAFAVTTTGAYGGTSGAQVLIKHGSTVLQSLSNPTPTQATLSGAQTVACTAGDTVSIVTSSSATVDNAPNAVKGIMNVFLGPL